MEIIESIRDNFNKGYFGKAMRIAGLPEEYPAWTLKEQEWYGVAVKLDRRLVFSERFSTARIRAVTNAVIDEQKANYLLLTCNDNDLRNEFAAICAQFVSTAPDGAERKRLISNPAGWWADWKALIGNRQSDHEVYSTIGELTIVEKLLQSGKVPKWSGIEHATHDIELHDRSYEVKSTISRYGYEVEVSSIYQMRDAGKPLSLAFLRFERSQLGRSLDEVVESIKALGYLAQELENALGNAGLEQGCTARAIRYKLLEMRVYPVDEHFPALTLASFVGGQLPPNITKVKYSVDLAGLAGNADL